MYFLKFLFLIFILAGSTSIGFLLSKKYVDRVRELKSLASLINILKNKIKFTHKPLGEIFEEVANIKKDSKMATIFLKAAENLKNKKCEQAWIDAIQEERNFLNLKDEDINLIKTFGVMLGKTDIEGQMSELEQFMILLEAQIKKAEAEQSKNEKMYKSLGTIVGLAIVIILY